jgi:hypothetical protein
LIARVRWTNHEAGVIVIQGRLAASRFADRGPEEGAERRATAMLRKPTARNAEFR